MVSSSQRRQFVGSVAGAAAAALWFVATTTTTVDGYTALPTSLPTRRNRSKGSVRSCPTLFRPPVRDDRVVFPSSSSSSTSFAGGPPPSSWCGRRRSWGERSRLSRQVAMASSAPTTTTKTSSYDPERFVSSFRGVHDFNAALDKLADRCADDILGREEDVVGVASRCEWMVMELERIAKETTEEGGETRSIMRPDTVSYNTVIKAWARASAALADSRGHGVTYPSVYPIPDFNVYTSRDAAERATHVLNEMERRYLTGESDVKPDVRSYNAAIDAWAKSRRAEDAYRAEDLLNHMMRLSTEGTSGNGVVNGAKEHWSQVAPDTITYNAVIDAYAHGRTGEGLKKAVKMLESMEETYANTGDGRIKPTIRTVNSVINAYAKCGTNGEEDGSSKWDSAEKAEKLLRTMLKRYADTVDSDYRPDVMTYTSVIDAWGRCGHRKATERAESLLSQMEQQYEETGDRYTRPNFRTYTAVITAWSKTRGDDNAPHRAEEILAKMEDAHTVSLATGEKVFRDERIKPNFRTYTAVINCWARSRDNTKPQRALRLLKKMNELYKGGDEGARPTLYTYNSVIDACSRCRGSSEQQAQALKIAFAVLKAVEAAKGVVPNQITYATLMKATANLMPAGKERNDVARALFEKCKRSGMVDDGFLKYFRLAVDTDVMLELLDVAADLKGFVDYRKIPPEWSCHVP